VAANSIGEDQASRRAAVYWYRAVVQRYAAGPLLARPRLAAVETELDVMRACCIGMGVLRQGHLEELII
jgi:hypothetical protein